MDPTAALIVHKQVEFTRQFSRTRSTTFASSVADRFYSDNSLDRQRRIVECTKRRQARAREKALEQEQELSHLQQQYEHKQRLRGLQSQRETSRMTRRLHHVAAAYIQYVFRRFRQRKRAQLLRALAARFIADFVRYRWQRRCQQRLRASLQIQRYWRDYKSWQKTVLCIKVIQKFMSSIARARRHKRQLHATRIQRCIRLWRLHRRRSGACCIQRAWRSFCLWRGICRLAEISRHRRASLHRGMCARVLQRTIARFTVRHRLLRSPAFAHFLDTSERRRRWLTRSHDRPPTLWETQRRLLANAATHSKRLQAEEAKLRVDLEQLTIRATESREKRAEEQERLRRFHAWAELRRSKEDEALREQLREWETRKRFEIRMELERELELERRAQLRSQQLQLQRQNLYGRSTRDEDERVEVSS